ncbi:MAG: hypothetical protein WA906_09265 [Pacificimonas sp.]
MSRLTSLAIAVSLTTLTVGTAFAPVHAATDYDRQCETMPADIRAAAIGAEDRAARRAVSKAEIGAALCEAGNERGASKKFKQALKALGIEKEELAQR